MAGGLAMRRTYGGGFNPSALVGMISYWVGDDQAANVSTTFNGTGTGNLAFSAGVVTATTVGNVFTGTGNTTTNSRLAGSFVRITGQPTPANNGVFQITSWPAFNQLAWSNPSGVSEAFTGQWAILGKMNTLVDRYGRSFTNASTHDTWMAVKPLPNGKASVLVQSNIPSSKKFLSLDSTSVAGNFNGAIDWTFGGYYYWPTPGTGRGFTAVGALDPSVATDSGTSFIRLRIGAAATDVFTWMLSTVPVGSNQLTVASASLPTASYKLVVVTLDQATRTAELFVDGVSQGTATTAVGSKPSPSALRYIVVGDHGSTSGNVTREMYSFGQYWAAGVKHTVAQQNQMRDWYAAKAA